MKRRVVIIFAAATALVMLFGAYHAGFAKGKERDELYKKLDVLAESMAIVDRDYVEPTKAKDLVYGAMSGMMESLDSYSLFMTPDEYKELLVDTEGQFGGLGVEIVVRENLLTIVSPIEDTPAWDLGLAAGDIIVKINGVSTKGITIGEAVKKLRGEAGTKVTLTVLGEKDKKMRDVSLTRAIVKIKDIKRAQILEPGVGYLRLSEFRENSAKEMEKALKNLNSQGMKGLVIDLRNNPGGLLYSAIDATSFFIKDGEVIVSTKSRTQKEEVYKAGTQNNKCLDIPIVVLINKGSASGSEIMASALRDHQRAVLVGETTFGKGSVQTVKTLSDGSALRLTTAKYYTPKGVSIHEKGVDPDIKVVLGDDKAASSSEDEVFENLDKDQNDKNKFNYKKDIQLVRAVDLLRGLMVLAKKQ
jgi:carboxyl-terminal processing protease